MASQYSTTGTFTIQRLRTGDTSFLAGAIDSPGPVPLPSAIATGPLIVGPGTGFLAAERWTVAVTMPAAPELAWVILRTEMALANAGASAPTISLHMCTFGDIADQDNSRGPYFGTSSVATEVSGTPAGTYSQTKVADPADGASRSLFLPLDTSLTGDGWTPTFTGVSDTGGVNANQWRWDLRNVQLLGYPANLWNTGSLWAWATSRGT
jgi:hypothetical protein